MRGLVKAPRAELGTGLRESHVLHAVLLSDTTLPMGELQDVFSDYYLLVL